MKKDDIVYAWLLMHDKNKPGQRSEITGLHETVKSHLENSGCKLNGGSYYYAEAHKIYIENGHLRDYPMMDLAISGSSISALFTAIGSITEYLCQEAGCTIETDVRAGQIQTPYTTIVPINNGILFSLNLVGGSS